MDFLGIIRFETLNGTKFDPTTPPVLYVNDNSRNGVVFNGQEMQRGETRMVKDGDELEIKTAALLTYEALSLDPITPSYTHHNTDATVGKWQITPIKIGCGSFGSVYVARLSGSLKSFAVKVLHPKIPDLTLSNSRSNREYNLLNGIKHVRSTTSIATTVT
ncbi:uncharacterized protein LODBEIA_P37080 [Lodderomyces beijingensis]|uniref:FHA domain-containing protein n=1 Tax=Lodderomyces beijingensis TaxID=1775926 RepID=A0ABP0ZNL7_9ASCO